MKALLSLAISILIDVLVRYIDRHLKEKEHDKLEKKLACLQNLLTQRDNEILRLEAREAAREQKGSPVSLSAPAPSNHAWGRKER
jgi:hypothetical protein